MCVRNHHRRLIGLLRRHRPLRPPPSQSPRRTFTGSCMISRAKAPTKCAYRRTSCSRSSKSQTTVCPLPDFIPFHKPYPDANHPIPLRLVARQNCRRRPSRLGPVRLPRRRTHPSRRATSPSASSNHNNDAPATPPDPRPRQRRRPSSRQSQTRAPAPAGQTARGEETAADDAGAG